MANKTRYCVRCCPDCDPIGYVRDAVFDEDTKRLVPLDYLCRSGNHLQDWGDICDGCGVAAFDT